MTLPVCRSLRRRIPACMSLCAALAAAPMLGLLTGCENAGQGAVSGASVGALSGLAIGSMSGNAGRGAATGAIVGGVGGAVVGDQNRRQNQRAATPPPAPIVVAPARTNAPQAQPLSSADRDRLALARFARTWRVSGWETVNGERRFVNGNAAGSVDCSFFVRLDMSMFDEQSGRMNTGNLVFASEPGRGVTMSSRFDTSPSLTTYLGTATADGTLFTLDEMGWGGSTTGRRIIIRFLSADEFVADVSERWGGQSSQQASFTFTAAR